MHGFMKVKFRCVKFNIKVDCKYTCKLRTELISLNKACNCKRGKNGDLGIKFDTLDVHESVHRDTTLKITNKMH
jgi:hypothetical protein